MKQIVFSIVILACMLSQLPVRATVDESLYTIKRNETLSEESLTQDYLSTRDLFSNVDRRLQASLAAFRDAPLGRAEIDHVIAQMALINVQFLLNSRELEAAARDLDIALTRLRNAQLSLMTSRPVEMRGMYIDAGAIPHTKEGISLMLDRLQLGNFNAILPEVSRRGYAIYESKYTDRDPEFKDLTFDPVWELIRESHKRDMQIYPWFWIFRVNSPGFGNPILSRLPELTAMPADVNTWKETTPRFMSPAHPDAREMVKRRLQEFSERYPVEGILLDYIRYDETIPEDQISFSRFRMDYLRKYGEFPPLKIERGTKLFVDWQSWREDKVNRTVQMLKEKLRSFRNKEVTLGGAVFRSESYSRLTKMQHWRHWADNNWVDFLTPMLYTSDKDDLHTWLDWETDFGKRRDILYPGLGAHRFQTPNDLFGQIGVLRERQIPGLTIFALSHFNLDTLPDLVTGPFRQKAVIPHHNLPESLRVLTWDMSFWFRKILAAEKGPDIDVLTDLSKTMRAAAERYGKYERQSFTIAQARQPIQETRKKVQQLHKDSKITLAFRQEIEHTLDYATFLIDVEERQRKQKGKYIPSSVPPVGILPETRPLPSVDVPFISAKAQIDGSLAEPLWEQAAELKVQYWHNGTSKTDIDTTVKLAYNNEYLYIAYINEEPDMKKVKANATGADNGNIFVSDDAIEVFLAPSAQSKENYYHFTVNTNNAHYDQHQKDVKWNGKWESQIQKSEQIWIVEMAIPFSDIGLDMAKGMTLAGNFYRDRHQDINPYYAWSAPYGSYHTPPRFGTIILK